MSEYSKTDNPFNQAGGSFARNSNAGMIALLDTYCAIKRISRHDLDVEQGCYHTGYKPSAGTHDRSDCKDLSPYDWEDKCWTLNLIGGMAEYRTKAQGFPYHIHMGRLFAFEGQAWLVAAQCRAYLDHNSNGLGNLSHTRTQRSPRNRSIQHIQGPIKSTYVSKGAVKGYSQPNAASDLVSATHEAGWELTNIAGVVQSAQVRYFVNINRTFFRVSDFALKGTAIPVDPTPAPLPIQPPAPAPSAHVLTIPVATHNVIERRLTRSGKNRDSAGPYTDVQKGQDYDVRVPLLAKKNSEVFRAWIIGTQESGTYANANALSKAYGPTWKNILHGDNRGDLTNAVHWDDSKVKMLKEGKFVVLNAKHNDHNWATWVMLEEVSTKRDILSSSFHADYRQDDAVLKVQAASWAKQLKAIGNGTRVIVAMADANESRDEKTDEFGMEMRKAGFVETEVACPIEHMHNKQYTSTLPSNSTKPRKGTRHIDRIWVWVPPEAKLTVNQWGIAVQLTSTGKIPQPIASDHWGTYASITIQYKESV